MQVKYSVDWQQYLTQDVVDEMVSVISHVYMLSCMVSLLVIVITREQRYICVIELTGFFFVVNF